MADVRRASSSIPARAETLRPAAPADAAAIWELVREHAAYETLEEALTGSARMMGRHLAGLAEPHVLGTLAELDGELIGYALYFPSFLSFRTATVMWLADLFVRKERRGSGFGKALLRAAARAALERGCLRLEWAVLDGNAPGIAFYETLGAKRSEGWRVYQIEGDSLRALAGKEGA